MFNAVKAVKALVATTALAVGIGTFASNANAALPLENQTLTAAFSVAPPFVIVNSTLDDLSGIDVDVVRELQRRTGFKLTNNRMEVMNFGDMMDMGAQGKIDIIGGGIYITPEREKTFDFTAPVYRTSIALVTNSTSGIRTLKDLNGRLVAAEMGTSAEDVIPPGSGIHVNMLNTPTNFMAFYMVSRNHADAMLTDAPLAEDYINNWKGSNLRIAEILPGTESDMGIVLKKNTNASRVIQQAYMDMVKDGTMDKLLHKYNFSYNVARKNMQLDSNSLDSAHASKDVAPAPVKAVEHDTEETKVDANTYASAY